MDSLILVSHPQSLPSPALRIAHQHYEQVTRLPINDSELSDPLSFLKLVLASELNISNNIFFDLFGVHLSTPIKVLVKLSHALKLTTPNLTEPSSLDCSDILLENSNTVIGECKLSANDIKIGRSCCISDYVLISEGVDLGRYCYIGPHSVISSEAVIGDFSSIGSHIQVARHTRLAKFSYITKPFSLIDSNFVPNISQTSVPDFSVYY
jgi:hypothetical protein